MSHVVYSSMVDLGNLKAAVNMTKELWQQIAISSQLQLSKQFLSWVWTYNGIRFGQDTVFI